MAAQGYGQTSVTTSATKIADGEQNAPSFIQVKAASGGGDLYLGFDASVTSGTGYLLPAGSSDSIPVDPGAAVYAVSSTGTVVASWLRSRNGTRGA